MRDSSVPYFGQLFWLAFLAIGHAAVPSLAQAQNVQSLLGTWSGRGKVTLKAGNRESIKCNAYNKRDGNELSLVVRCASPSYKIEIRSKLIKRGAVLTGHWEERTYNATGTASGMISAKSVELGISGGGFRGRMDVAYTRSHQTIKITTEGIDLKSVEINLVRTR